MYKLAIFFAALMVVAGTAQAGGFGNAKETVVLDCGIGIIFPPFGDPNPPPPEPKLLVAAVSGTSGAPGIENGDECGVAIGLLINSRFMLLSATPSGAFPLGLPEGPNPAVQYLFVSKPRWGSRWGED